MASVFTLIIQGDLPGHFVWKDETCVAFLSINPLAPGHTLVVPRAEIEHWLDVPVEEMNHLTEVSAVIGRAQERIWRPEKVGLMIAGLEVPHVHLHVVPINSVHDLDFANADPDPDPADLVAAASRIRAELSVMGHSEAATT